MKIKSGILLVVAVVLGASSCLFGYSGGYGTALEPYQIANKADFLELSGTPGDYDKIFVLTSDINLNGEVFDNSPIAEDINNADAGFQGTVFTGIFDGGEYVISNLTIDVADANDDYLGLFGRIEGLGIRIKNLRLKNINIIGGDISQPIGGICGENHLGTIDNCYVTGSIRGGCSSRVFGGICGNNYQGIINNCYATVVIAGYSFLGGICGNNYLSDITNCYAISSVTGTMNIGGLCGSNYGGDLVNCYVVGTVTGGDGAGPMGGLCGINNYIITTVSGQKAQVYESNIIDCYSESVVTSGANSGPVGGLCGSCSSNIKKSYSTGKVKAGINSVYVGGLCGHSYGSITNSFWDVETSGIGVLGGNNYGATGKTTVQMQTGATFTDAGWDFAGTWWINEGRNYPKLSYQPIADFNSDGLVNFYDFAIMAIAWQATDSDTNYNRICELTGDSTIDEADLAVLAGLWLQGPLFPVVE